MLFIVFILFLSVLSFNVKKLCGPLYRERKSDKNRVRSDGLRSTRHYENNYLFSKLNIPLEDNLTIDLTTGCSRSDAGYGNLPNNDLTSSAEVRTFFSTFSLDAWFRRGLSLSGSAFIINHKLNQSNNTLGLGLYSNTPDLFLNNLYDEITIGVNSNLVWKQKQHTAVLGWEYNWGDSNRR